MEEAKPIENCLRRDDVYFLGRSFLESEIYSERKVEKLTTEKQQNQNTNIYIHKPSRKI